MTIERMSELILMLLVENKCLEHKDFYEYIDSNYSIIRFNNRYNELLDEFLNEYALSKAEKSE